MQEVINNFMGTSDLFWNLMLINNAKTQWKPAAEKQGFPEVLMNPQDALDCNEP